MTDGDKKRFALNVTKEIVIAKLGTTAPASSNSDAGQAIADMFEAIYNKILELTP